MLLDRESHLDILTDGELPRPLEAKEPFSPTLTLRRIEDLLLCTPDHSLDSQSSEAGRLSAAIDTLRHREGSGGISPAYRDSLFLRLQTKIRTRVNAT